MKIFILLFLFNGVMSFDKSWWKHTIIYEIFVWSFKDSNGDGVGDINGITTTLDHFVDLDIETIYLSPFFKSPMEDSGYDISNFTDIDPKFGTMQDFEELMHEMKKRGLKLVIDFVINHSSDAHKWFQQSIKRIDPYTNYYVWKDPKNFNADGSPNPPNNWLSIFGGSAWEWNEERKQYFLHQFSVNQPDLNSRDEKLKSVIFNILRFWLEKGIAGIRLDAPIFFMEDALFRDEHLKEGKNVNSTDYFDWDHEYTIDLWETYEFVHELRNVIDEFNAQKKDFERILTAEAYTTMNHTMQYYGQRDYPIAHFPYNFEFLKYNKNSQNATFFNNLMHKWLDSMPRGATANWNVENHDNPRVESRLNQEFSDIMIITLMMAPGVPYIYYGQEIGMTNHMVRPDQLTDKFMNVNRDDNRDPERVPMQWNDSPNAGFTANHIPWLPVNSNYWKVNVEKEKKQPNSRYNLFKTLSALRKTKTLKHGRFISHVLSTWIFAFARTLKGYDTYIIVHNLGSETEFVNLHINFKDLPQHLEVVASSANSGYVKGTKVSSNPKFPESFNLRPMSSVVLKAIAE